MPRLFTALEVPPDIAQDLSFSAGGLPGARWIDAENYHVTLRFIGDVGMSLAREIAAELARIARPAFAVAIDGLSAFGGAKPRAIIATVEALPPLVELQAEQERLMRRLGLEAETRKFTPHVTLARLRQTPSLAVADYLSSRSFQPRRTFEVTRFVLMSSRDSIGGGPYAVEAEYPLV